MLLLLNVATHVAATLRYTLRAGNSAPANDETHYVPGAKVQFC